ncbi:unnamed protein product [Musa acuminata var. zebrina]
MYVHARLYSSQPHVLHYIYIHKCVYICTSFHPHPLLVSHVCIITLYPASVSLIAVLKIVLNLMKMSVLIVVLKISLMIVYQTHLSKVERSKTHIQHNFKK